MLIADDCEVLRNQYVCFSRSKMPAYRDYLLYLSIICIGRMGDTTYIYRE